ncbi:MAG: prepilin-type N-terminal cleavage/methylation domain-containing protein [Planctomycetota bacterium]
MTRRTPHSGYTLIEVLVTVTVIGLASVVIVPSLMRGGELGLQAAARIIIADILLAQNDAIAYQSPRRVAFDIDNNEYRLEEGTVQSDGTISWALVHADWLGGSGGNYIVDFDTDSRFDGVVLIEADFDRAERVAFDELGGPTDGGFVRLRFEDQTYRIDVAEFTGRVSVTRE